jgi:hypothetical protein
MPYTPVSKKPEGQPTRGKTASNRLRRLHNFILLYADERTFFRLGGFNLPLKEGEHVRLIRAFNVLRQYEEQDFAPACERLAQYVLPGQPIYDFFEAWKQSAAEASAWTSSGTNLPILASLKRRVFPHVWDYDGLVPERRQDEEVDPHSFIHRTASLIGYFLIDPFHGLCHIRRSRAHTGYQPPGNARHADDGFRRDADCPGGGPGGYRRYGNPRADAYTRRADRCAEPNRHALAHASLYSHAARPADQRIGANQLPDGSRQGL